LWPDHIIEVQSHESTGGHIVWEWHVWDHLIQNADSAKSNFGKVVDHPELIDINYSQIDIPDWNHTNGIDYHADLDQIILSVREFCEFWIIDHSTTTEEAAGHMGGRYGKGGDILYRWGNPNSYKTGTREEQRLFYQHDAQWIRDELVGGGHILVFNNGVGRPKGEYSSVDEIVPPVDQDGNYIHITDFPYGPLEPIWIYTSPVPTDFYSSYISGAQRSPNGNTLICSGETGTFLEVTQDKELVWKYINPVVGSGPIAQGDTIPEEENQPVNHVFRAYRYGPDYSGLAGHDLNPGDPIELYQDQVSNRQLLEPDQFGVLNNYPNPFNGNTNIIFEFPSKTKVKLMITDLLGNQLKIFNLGSSIGGRYAIQWDGKDFQDHPVNSGIYFCRLQFDNHFMTRKMVIIK